jgi:hypothetical protein
MSGKRDSNFYSYTVYSELFNFLKLLLGINIVATNAFSLTL